MVASVGLRKCGLWPVLPSPAGVKPRRSVWSLLCPFRRSPRFAVRRRTLLGPLSRPFACHDRAHIRPSRRPHRPLHVPSPSRLLLLSPRCLRVAPDRSLARRPRLGPSGGLGVFKSIEGDKREGRKIPRAHGNRDDSVPGILPATCNLVWKLPSCTGFLSVVFGIRRLETTALHG